MSVTAHGPIISPFRIDILDASNNILGDGPLNNVTKLDTTDSLDKIGSCAFEVPSTDQRTAYITAGRKFDIYSAEDGVHMRYLGRYSYSKKSMNDASQPGNLVVTCYDALRELSKGTVGFRRTYTNIDVAAVIGDLVNVASGWSSVVDIGIGNTTVSFEGESPFAAIDVLRDRWGQHFRLQNTSPALRILEFGAFGDDSGIHLLHLQGQVQGEIDMKPEVAIVESIELLDEADEIFNSIIPLGAGTGVTQLTIEKATLGTYDVDEGTNEDGSSYWYIQDDTSVTNYGALWRVVTFPQIRPITNSAANIVNAANALKLTAEAYIARHLAPRVTYGVSVRGLRNELQVGDTVHLKYKGVVEGYSYINVDDDFYVLDITRSRSVTGERSARLIISTVAERRTTDTDIVLDVVRDISALKVHVAPTQSYSPIGPVKARMDASNDAEIEVRIEEEVQQINYAKLRFKTSPLRSSLASATTSESGSHRHLMFIYFMAGPSGQLPDDYFEVYKCYRDPDGEYELAVYLGTNYPVDEDLYTYEEADGHTHDMSYGLYEDTQYPTSLSVAINGLDRTTELGGPWDLSGEGADVSVDITNWLVNAVGGLQQNHTITFSCASGQGEIEVEVGMLVTIQPILLT